MDKIVSYHEFLKHKDNLAIYLHDLFDKIPDVTVYFPINLSSEERHLIYTNSKGYLFEKLHKVGSKYSVKLWKSQSVSDENSDLVTGKDEDETDPDYSPAIDLDEEYDMQEHLTEISEKLDKHNDIMLNNLDRCYRTVKRVECIFACIMISNFVGSMMLLSHMIGNVTNLPPLRVITDF